MISESLAGGVTFLQQQQPMQFSICR